MIEEIERFHSRGRHTCRFTETKESVYIRKEFNSHRTGSVGTPTWPPFNLFCVTLSTHNLFTLFYLDPLKEISCKLKAICIEGKT